MGARAGVWGVFALVLGAAGPARGAGNPWVCRGPEGGYVRSLAVEPRHTHVVLAGVESSRVFRSADGGASWKRVVDDLRFRDPTRIVSTAPDSVYVFGSGCYHSTDGGTTWTLLPISASDIAVSAANPQIVYAG